MTTDNPLPHRLILLGENLNAMLSRIENSDERFLLSDGYADDDILDAIKRHLSLYQSHIKQLMNAVLAIEPDILENESSQDADVYRTVAKIEVAAEALLQQQREIAAWSVFGSEAEYQQLLSEALEFTMDETLSWLQELTDVLIDPIAYLKRRGLPTEGYVELPLKFTLNAPPSMSTMQQCLKRDYSDSQKQLKQKGLGLLGWLGLFWLGSELFDDCD
jgi:hypothetical protein